jgi:hypothetical protein
MLTDQEVNKIFSWEPYREDWSVDRKQVNSGYGDLIKDLTTNELFDTYYSEDGGLGNYLEFICYPGGHKTYNGSAIIVCVSLCSPVAAYGQTRLTKRIDFIGWDGLFSPDKIYVIGDCALTEIVKEVKSILTNQKLILLDKDFVSRPLPVEMAENLLHENHNEGNQYLHGIFQKMD